MKNLGTQHKQRAETGSKRELWAAAATVSGWRRNRDAWAELGRERRRGLDRHTCWRVDRAGSQAMTRRAYRTGARGAASGS